MIFNANRFHSLWPNKSALIKHHDKQYTSIIFAISAFHTLHRCLSISVCARFFRRWLLACACAHMDEKKIFKI